MLVSLSFALALGAPSPRDGPPLPAPAELAKAFEALEPAARLEIVEWHRLEMSKRAGLQQGFVRHVLAETLGGADPGLFAPVEPAPIYDAQVHAPKEPVPRALVSADDRRAKSARKLFLGDSARELERGFVYDWATGEIRRVADERGVERAFRNALNGYSPDLDLAEALLLRWLDDGSQRKALAAFAHAYVDRAGNALPGITLYDAWSSGESFEMPDVDVLGLVHDLEDEWKRWRAPISASDQPKLYAHVGDELFAPARRHRGLREALARAYFVGAAELRDGYADHLDRFHALWEFHGASPVELRAELPTPKNWKRFLDDWAKKTNRDKKLLAQGRSRRAALEAEAHEVYATLVGVMREFGALGD